MQPNNSTSGHNSDANAHSLIFSVQLSLSQTDDAVQKENNSTGYKADANAYVLSDSAQMPKTQTDGFVQYIYIYIYIYIYTTIYFRRRVHSTTTNQY